MSNTKIKERIKEYEWYTFLDEKMNSLIAKNIENEIQISMPLLSSHWKDDP